MNAIKTFLNKSYRRQDGKYAVYVSTVVTRIRVQFPVGLVVSEEEWDEENQLIKETVANAKDWNLIINNIIIYKLNYEY